MISIQEAKAFRPTVSDDHDMSEPAVLTSPQESELLGRAYLPVPHAVIGKEDLEVLVKALGERVEQFGL